MINNKIITKSESNRLRALSANETTSKWKAGDIALIVMSRFRILKDDEKDKEAKKYEFLHELQVWNAVGSLYGGVSGRRVQQIATVCAAFPHDFRYRYNHWSFGYFEAAIALDEQDWLPCIEFLDSYANGVFNKTKKLNVGDLVWHYRAEILGQVMEDISPPDPFDPEMIIYDPVAMNQQDPNSYFARLEAQSAIKITKSLRSLLGAFSDNPKISKIIEILDELSSELPGALTVLQEKVAQSEEVEV